MNANYLKIAHTLADKAGEIARQYFRKDFDMALKDSLSPLVTQADLAIEMSLRNYLGKVLPEHGILGEEYSDKTTSSEYVWVIDPIDGTSAFGCGKPTFSTLIALLKNGVPILGVIEQPILKERWCAVQGESALFNNMPCMTGAVSKSGIIRINCTTPFMFNESEWKVFKNLKKLGTATSFGGDGYAYGLLASGFIDIILESDLKIYDIAASIPIINSAGGCITDWQGREITLDTFNGTALAARNSVLHAQALEIIANGN
jgi:inositol-phosphate phosphatase/L-galactose 1-phosphate phosphatase/histidinol-phosphatase